MHPSFRIAFLTISLGSACPFLRAAQIAGSDFSTSAVFNAAGGSYDNSAASTDDLDPTDGVSVSNWSFANGGGLAGLDSNAQVGMPSYNVTKFNGINGSSATPPSLGSSGAALATHSFTLTIPVGSVLNLTSVTFDWRKATDGANQRWLAFDTSADSGIIFAEIGLTRNAVDNQTIDLSGATYQGLTGTVTFNFYAGGEGSGDIDIDTIIVNGEVSSSASSLPTVINSAAADITPTSATLGGEVTDTGGGNTSATLYWGYNDGGTNPANWDNAIPFGNQTGAFSSLVSGLTPSTTYYFRSLATNSMGDDWANSTATFSTGDPPDPPVVSNSAATNVTFTSADLNGEVTDTGGETPNVIIYFGDNDGGTTPGNWDDSVSVGAQSGAFSNSLFALTNNTTYYFRTFAENSGGSSWSPNTSNFTTQAFSPPTVENTAAGNITGTAAQVGGEVTGTGGDPPNVRIYYGDNDGGTTAENWDDFIDLGIQNDSFAETLASLNPLTTYYFRSFAQNGGGQSWAPSTESFTTLDFSELIINEFMAANDGGLSNNPNSWYPLANQVPGSTDDWIEIHNTGATTLDLAGWSLTDDAANLTKWTFPSTSLPAGGFLIVYASGNNAPDANGNLHTNFRLSAGGEYLALVRPAGTVANEFGPAGSDYPNQENDISYGLHPATSESVYFASPTPGAANDPSGIAQVSDTKFSPDRGYYQSAIDVTLTTDTLGAMIYYTTDGTVPIDTSGNPTSSATAYSGPIPITQTTSVRAAAVKAGLSPTDVDAHSYILLDIDNANHDGTDAAGLNTSFLEQVQPAGWGNLTSGDYNMDTTVSKNTSPATNHPTTTAQTMLLGLRDIPTISISMNRDDFSGSGGIYTNSTSGSLEKACSAEFIPAPGDPRSDWQVNCGIKVQGGSSRNPSSSPKHSLNFRFRTQYGPGKLRQPLFPGSEVEEFNSITLRAGYNNSWIHRDAGQRDRGSMIRDQWMRESMLDMGNPAAGEGFMTHVFINGLYWGVHNLCERPESSHYAAYNGGNEDLLDARNGGSFVDGNSTAWNQIDDVINTGNWTHIQQAIDIPNYIDYQIINRYGGNADLKTSGNWRAAGGGPFPAGQPELMAPWQLYSWDGERTLESPSSTISPLDPMGVRGLLEANDEYRMLFADHLQRHFFNDGALTPDATEARWEKFASDLDRAIIAESARWGDHRGTLYTRDNQWLSEQSRLYNSYFPVRSANVLNLYRSQGMFPNIDAPVFLVNGSPQHGGEIPAGGILTISATSGTIYYTTDGSDPRLEGGTINPSATAIASGTTVTLANSGLIRTRALDTGEWSAIDEATFFLEALVQAGDLAVTEIHYNPYRPTPTEKAAGFTDADEFEFVEFRNISATSLNLNGVAFTEGIAISLGNIILAPGDHAVLVKNPAAFALRHPTVSVAGTFSGSLDNNGETLTFTSSTGTLIQSFTYDNSGAWPGRADGNGSSLEVLDTSGDYNDSDNWRSSSEFNGSPGATGAGPDGRIVINEVLSNPAGLQSDTIELYNTTGSTIDISGWIISDDNEHYPSFQIPAATFINANSYLTFDASDFNPTPGSAITLYAGTLAAAPTTVTSSSHGLTTGDTITIEGYGGISNYDGTWEVTVLDGNNFTIDTPFLDNHPAGGNWIAGRPFGLSASNGESLWLMETDLSGRPTRFVETVDYGASFEGDTLGRWLNGEGYNTLIPMTGNTLGFENLGPQIGPVVISEVMYFPTGATEDLLEFVEICNAGTNIQNLANWRLRGGADFDFTASHSLAPGELLVIVAFDPVANTTATNTFRAHYGIDASIPLVGPFLDGPLGNTDGTIRLQQPDAPPSSDPTFHPQVTADEVRYQSTAPWPTAAAGSGSSLDRTSSDLFGNFATSWTAEDPSPGGKRYGYDSWSNAFFGSGSPPNSDFDEDFNGDSIANGIAFALGLNPLAQNTGLTPQMVIEGTNATMTYERNLLLDDLTYRVEYSADLAGWLPANETVISTTNNIETRKASVPTGSFETLFLRFVVEQP